MKKKTFIWMIAATVMTLAMSITMSGCVDAEEGESKEDWELRNTLNGAAWHVDMLKVNGNWLRWEEAGTIYFNVRFYATDYNFKSEKFYYNANGESDETTREEYNTSDKTAFTIKDAKIIEGTVGGQPYFRFTLSKKPSSSMEGTLYFYKEKKTFEVIMTR